MNDLKIRLLKNQIHYLEKQIFVISQNINQQQDTFQDIHNNLIEFINLIKKLFQVNLYGDQYKVKHSEIVQLIDKVTKIRNLINNNISNIINDKFPNNSLIIHQYCKAKISTQSSRCKSYVPDLNIEFIMKLEYQLSELYKILIQNYTSLKIIMGEEFISVQNEDFKNLLRSYKSEYKNIIELLAQYTYLIFHKKKKPIQFSDTQKQLYGKLRSQDKELIDKKTQLSQHKLLLLKSQNEILSNEIIYYRSTPINQNSNNYDENALIYKKNVSKFLSESILEPLQMLIDSFNNLKLHPDDDDLLEKFLLCCESNSLLKKDFNNNFVNEISQINH